MIISDEVSEDVEEPDEVKQAWDELVIIQREQQRYTDIKLDLHQDLDDYKKRQKHLEDVSHCWYQYDAFWICFSKKGVFELMIKCDGFVNGMLQELPKRISTVEEAEILTLLCKVHELEIGKVRDTAFLLLATYFFYVVYY